MLMARFLPAGTERRGFVHPVELRAAPQGRNSPGTLSGYAAVYGKRSSDLGGFIEQIERGAFRDCLSHDVRALFNHNDHHILGRTKAGTLRLFDEPKGLRYEVDLPDTTAGRDVAESVRRGDVTGSSFQFKMPPEMTGERWEWDGPTAVRTVHKVHQLYDVGPVVYPAYEATHGMTVRDAKEAARRAEIQKSINQATVRLRLAKAYLSAPTD